MALQAMQVRGRRLLTSDISPAFPGYFSKAAAMSGAAGSMWRSTAALDCAFVAVCTPSLSAADVLSTSLLDGGAVAWDTTIFRSQHHIDMKFISVDAKSDIFVKIIILSSMMMTIMITKTFLGHE